MLRVVVMVVGVGRWGCEDGRMGDGRMGGWGLGVGVGSWSWELGV